MKNDGASSGGNCNCRLCSYDRAFAEQIAFVPPERRAFFEALKEDWEAADFDATWYRGCVGGNEMTDKFLEAYELAEEAVKRRYLCDSGSDRNGENTAGG